MKTNIRKLLARNKIEKNLKINQSTKERNKESKMDSKIENLSEIESLSIENDEVDNFSVTPFLELTPLDIQIENSPRKDFSSVPII